MRIRKRGRRCATQKLFQPNFVSCYQPHNTWLHHSFIASDSISLWHMLHKLASSPTFYIFTQHILYFHSAQLFTFSLSSTHPMYATHKNLAQYSHLMECHMMIMYKWCQFNGTIFTYRSVIIPLGILVCPIGVSSFVFVCWHVTTLTPIIKLFVPLLKNQVKSSEQENINVKIVLSP